MRLRTASALLLTGALLLPGCRAAVDVDDNGDGVEVEGDVDVTEQDRED